MKKTKRRSNFEELRDLVRKHGRRKASEIQDGRTPYCLARAIETNGMDFSSFMGKELSSKEYNQMLRMLKEKTSIVHKSNLIKNHLEYGRKRIEWRLNSKSYDELDLLRITT